jgi:hypothetical protein
MGISIANAQKALNADYLQNIKQLMGLIKETMGNSNDESTNEKAQAMKLLLESLAPSRYQFTETTIDFSADLAETLDTTVKAGFGIGTQVIAINAAFSLGYGYDYRSAARIQATLHAYPTNPEVTKSLLSRAEKINSDKLKLPEEKTEVEEVVWKSTSDIFEALTIDKSDADKVGSGE